MSKPAPSLDQVVAALTDPTRRGSPTEASRRGDTVDAGVYAWWVDGLGSSDLAAGLGHPIRAGLIYAGLAGAGSSSATLRSRILGNHLGGSIRASTFRKTLASILRGDLRLEPISGGRMTADGEARLTAWILARLELSVAAYPDRRGLDAFETALLDRLDPPLNLSKRPPTAVRSRLTELRRPFRLRAASPAQGGVEPWMRSVVNPAVSGHLGGYTPEQLARELGLPNAKSVRAYLRREHPRDPSLRGSRWDNLPPEVEAAVRARYIGHRR